MELVLAVLKGLGSALRPIYFLTGGLVGFMAGFFVARLWGRYDMGL